MRSNPLKNAVPRVGLKPRLPLIIGVVVVLIGVIVLAVQAHHKIEHNMGRHQHIDAFDSYIKAPTQAISITYRLQRKLGIARRAHHAPPAANISKMPRLIHSTAPAERFTMLM